MRVITPKKVKVSEVIVTTSINESINRKFSMGYWIPEIGQDEIREYLDTNPSLLIGMVTGSSFYEDSKIDIIIITRYIDKGVVFEDTSEYTAFSKTGMSPGEFYEFTEFMEGISDARL